MAGRYLSPLRVLLVVFGAVVLARHVALADSRLALVVAPGQTSAAADNKTSSNFSELSIVPFHDAQAVHTFSGKSKEYVFIYCKQPGAIKTIAVTLSYGNQPPDKGFSGSLAKHVAEARLSVRQLDGRIEPFTTIKRVARTYHTAAGEYKSDIVLQFEDREFEKLKTAREFNAMESGFDISKVMDFEISGSRELFDAATKSCVG